MAAQGPNPNAVATMPSQALTLAQDGGVEYNLDSFPTERFNRLVPTQTIRMSSDLVVPVVQIVQLDPDVKGGDVYSNRDIGEGKAALTRVGLRKVATAAAVSIIANRRTDDGSKPGECEFTATAEMVLPTGQRIQAVGTKRIVMDDQAWASPAQRGKFQSALHEHTAARAENRAIRALLSLRGSYPVQELRKPFAVVTFAPNMNHPEVRAAVIASMTGTVSSLYGPGPAKAVGPGSEVTQVAAITAGDDDQDDVADAEYRQVQTNGHATVHVATGEIVADVNDDAPFGASDGAPTMAGFAGRLKSLADSRSRQTGPASQAQYDQLTDLFAGLTGRQLVAVMRQAFDGFVGDVEDGKRHFRGMQARQFLALAELHQTLGADQFRAGWIAAAEQLAAVS